MFWRWLRNYVFRFYVFLFFFYLIMPFIVVLILAFNKNDMASFPYTGFTFHWFVELFKDSLLIGAIKKSLFVAVAVTMISVSVSFLVAVALVRYRFFGRYILYLTALSPIVIPGLVIGLSILIFIAKLGFSGGIGATILGQSAFMITFIFLIMAARLRKFDSTLEEAAMDLGASRFRVLFEILIPFMTPAFVSGGFLSFMLSFNNFNTTLFLIGTDATLPIAIYSKLRFGIDPTINAISVLMIALVCAIVFTTEGAKRFYRG